MKKIGEEEFLRRFYRRYPDAKIEVLGYSAISKSLTIRCARCGREQTKLHARDFLKEYGCCVTPSRGPARKWDDVPAIAQEAVDFVFHGVIKVLHYNPTHQCTYKCLQCGFVFKQRQERLLQSKGCPKCGTPKPL